MGLAEVAVVGMKAGGREHIVAHVDTGDPVLLVHETDNPHDANAIAVYTAPRDALKTSTTPGDLPTLLTDHDRALLMDRQAGYLPRAVAAKLWIPEDGLMSEVAGVRYHPDGHEQEGVPAGFDVLLDYARYRRQR